MQAFWTFFLKNCLWRVRLETFAVLLGVDPHDCPYFKSSSLKQFLKEVRFLFRITKQVWSAKSRQHLTDSVLSPQIFLNRFVTHCIPLDNICVLRLFEISGGE